MTVRTREVGAVTVYAGTPDELAAIADAYVRGKRKRPYGYDAPLFRRAAVELRTDCRVIDLGAVRFYGDRRDGMPFHAPYAPDPDPEWTARRVAAGLSAGA